MKSKYIIKMKLMVTMANDTNVWKLSFLSLSVDQKNVPSQSVTDAVARENSSSLFKCGSSSGLYTIVATIMHTRSSMAIFDWTATPLGASTTSITTMDTLRNITTASHHHRS